MAGVDEEEEEDDDDRAADAVMLVFAAAASRGRAISSQYKYEVFAGPWLSSTRSANNGQIPTDRKEALLQRFSGLYGSSLPTQRIGVGVVITDVFFSNWLSRPEKNNAAVIRKTKRKDLNPSTPVANEEASCRRLRGITA